MSVKSRFLRIGEELAMEAVLEGVRGYLQELMAPVKPEHLAQAIEEDLNPWRYAGPKVRSRGQQWAQKLRNHSDKVTPDLVLEWLKEDRKDLYQVIVSSGPKGRAWLAKWTRSVKEQLWPTKEPTLVLLQVGEVEEPPQEKKQSNIEQDNARPSVKWG